jgi:bifunctional ADP-heptose synthase (sugar kinase/adenylyltransferase)
LIEARAQGDRLVVSVTADEFVAKGPDRPIFKGAERAQALRALSCVDDVIISESYDAVDVINKVRPNLFVKGVDYKDVNDAALQREIAAVEAHGGRFYTTHSDRWSSSRIVNGARFDDEAMAYLEGARARGFSDRILAAFERADKLKIAFVGETIIDRYHYVSPLGKPVKEFCLATVEAKESEEFLGGVIAASKHAEWPHVNVVTSGQFIRKTRYVDVAFNRKLFEVYSEREIELNEKQRTAFRSDLVDALKAVDAVVVLDFGHGLLTSEERSFIRSAGFRKTKKKQKPIFTAINSQSNTANFGFNPVTLHPGANFVCVDDPEARLATGMQNDPMGDVLTCLSDKMCCYQFIVTHGRNGCTSFTRYKNPAVHIPAFATNGIDTMGAGDAFLAVTAPLVAAGLGLEEAGFVGNVAGAIKVGILGHRRHVGRQELIQSVEALLK